MKKNMMDYELLWERITDYAKAAGRGLPVLYFYCIMYCEVPKLPLRINADCGGTFVFGIAGRFGLGKAVAGYRMD